MKIFGREPALILGLVASVVSLAGYQWGVSAGVQTAINTVAAAVVGLVLALMARSGAWAAAVLHLAQSLFALFAGLGLDWSAERQAVWLAVISAGLALYARTQITAPVPSTALEEGSPIRPRAPQAVQSEAVR